MARGRIIANEITRDVKINKLSDDTSRLAFTWLVTFADKEGRTHGDPAIVRSMVFPRRDDVSVAQMETYIREWENLGLIVWYFANEDYWISFPRFDKNQPGLRKEREPDSIIPPPNGDCLPDDSRKDDGNIPDNIPDKGKERNGIERNEMEGNILVDDSSTPEPNPSPITSEYQEIRQTWITLFPDKPKPREVSKALQGKVRTRWKSPHFRDNWRPALKRAAQSEFLHTGGWFDLGWFLKNDDNYEKCLNGNYDNKRGGNGKPRAPTEPKGYAGIRAYMEKEGLTDGNENRSSENPNVSGGSIPPF